MKITNRLSMICASVTLALFVFVSSVFADAPVPKTPAQDATLDLRPVQTLEYKFPADRNWDDEYNPVELKENNRDENSHPTPVDFEWTAVEDPEAIYMLELSTDPNFSDDSVIQVGTGKATACQATNLSPGDTWYWRVRASVKDSSGAKKTTYSEVASFRTAATLPRWFDLPSISNVRDAGGWNAANGKKMRMGMVFRGSALDSNMKLSEESRVYMVEKLGIRLDLDLRGSKEWGDTENYWSPLGKSVNWMNFPVDAYSGILNDKTKAMYRDIFAALAKPESYPVYIHCAAGADRAGTLNLAIKSVLGVSDSDLFADYEFTSFSVFGERRIGSDTFKKFREDFKRYGENEPFSVQFVNYLKECGVTDEELDAVRNILLEDAARP